MAAPRFQWHPLAVAVDAKGGRHRVGGLPPALVIDERPAVTALQTAFVSDCFRIGAGPAPQPADRPMFETLTGGTSGQPRRIWRSHASWITSFEVNAKLFGIGPGRRLAVLGRLIHSLALYGAMEGLHLGAEVHLLEGLRPDRQRVALADREIDLLYATPAQLRLLIEASGPNLMRLKDILVGGSKLDGRLRRALAAITPARVHEFYGAAEASFITLADADTPEDTVGRPYPGVELQLRGAERAEIWVRSSYLAQGYAGEDVGSAVWQDGWLYIGERGRLENGYLYLSGRAGRMITIADQNVFPEEIEAFLLGCPDVTRAAVLPIVDSLRGHVLVAVLVGNSLQEGDIFASLREKFGPLKAPRRVIWRADWPMLPSGKTDLAALEAGI